MTNITEVRLSRATLPCLLQGEERARAHAELFNVVLASRKAEVLAWLQRDPSLLVEPLEEGLTEHAGGNRFPAGTTQTRMDVVKGHGNWVSLMAHDCRSEHRAEIADAVIEMFAHGLHPDDETVFKNRPLLSREHWRTSPKLLKAALDAGAEVGPKMSEAGMPVPRAYLRLLLLDVKQLLSLATQGSVDNAINAMRCAHLLLDAGDRFFDIPLDQGSASARAQNTRTISAIGLLSGDWADELFVDQVAPHVKALMGRLVELGADINRHGNFQVVPPVVNALRMRNFAAACHLIGLGARIDDDFIVRRGTPTVFEIKDLLTEAREAGGDMAVAAVNEAIMKRRIALEACSASNDPVIHSARRRRAMA